MVFRREAIPIARSPWTPAVRDAYPHDVPNDDRCPSAVSVHRKVLSEQPDQSVAIVTTGWLVNLKTLLDSKPDHLSELNGKELVRAKVKELTVMGGAFPQGWEYNFGFAGVGACTKYVLDNWAHDICRLNFLNQARPNFGVPLSNTDAVSLAWSAQWYCFRTGLQSGQQVLKLFY